MSVEELIKILEAVEDKKIEVGFGHVEGISYVRGFQTYRHTQTDERILVLL